MSNQQLQLAQNEIKQARETFLKVPNTNLDFAREAGFANQLIQANPYLATMELASIRNCIINVALTGLSLNPVLKLAYLVPRKGKLILDPSYMGLINVLVTAGAAKKITADVVYENDEFTYEKGTTPFIKHIPLMKGDRGQIIGAYAIAWLPNGEVQFEIMSREELDKVKRTSESVKSGKQSPYDSWEGEMFRKAPVKRLFKYLPKHNIPDRVSKVLELEEEHNGVDFKAENQQSTKSKIEKIIDDEAQVISDETNVPEVTAEEV